jgi:hypothetical protein
MSAFMESYLGYGRGYFIGAIIEHQSKFLPHTLRGWLPLLANARPRRKGFVMTNALAYSTGCG